MFTWIVVIVFVILFGIAVFWFRSSKNTKPQAGMDSTANILTPVSVSSSVVNGAVNLESPNATLLGVSSKKAVGTAVRDTQATIFRITMSATLPEIDREKHYYQAWLVRQVPYDYIPVGSFITNDLGTFVLDWNSESEKTAESKSIGNYQAYTHIVVTLQTKDGDPDPQRHVVEGDFGK